MDRAITSWLSSTPLPPSVTTPLAARLRKTRYTLHGPLLLLPSSTTLTTPSPHPPSDLEPLFAALATGLKVTHIAVSTPIPSTSSSPLPSSTTTTSPVPAPDSSEPNILRAPRLQPLYGDFGPDRLLSASTTAVPTPEDFHAAFWVTARQNGIAQTWAPRWTMFSRGNVTEKARILALESVRRAVEEGEEVRIHGNGDGRGGGDEERIRGAAAVDLYVGIGYFAFSYLRAGFRAVVGWDLNAWSLEGLRRGAGANGWECEIVDEGEEVGEEKLGQDPIEGVLAFRESNVNAARRIRALRTRLPPIRHVNCGLLPTSRDSWETAVEVLDPQLGGWVHVHENFAVAEIEEKAEEVRSAFQGIADARGRQVRVEVEYVNRLKSYAPGVVHCVVDLHLAPVAERV